MNYPDESTLAIISIGQRYEFFAEMQEAEKPAAERMRNYTGQSITVVALAVPRIDDEEQPPLWRVRAADGREFLAQEEELNGWDKALGQYFWPDGTYGPDHASTFLSNEGSAS